LLGLCHNNLEGIGRGAINSQDLKTTFQGMGQIYRESVFNEDYEAMTGANVLGSVDSPLLQIITIACGANQAGS